jgi:CHAD domain-containing protein
MNNDAEKLAPVFGANGCVSRDGAVPRKALPPDTLPHLVASLKTQWKRYRKKLKRCQKRFSTDAVHDSRVETRRLLSLVELLEPFLAAGRLKKVERSLKRYLDTFDDLRDTQVQILHVRKLLRPFPVARSFNAYLRKREERFAERTREDIKRFKTKRLNKLIAACRQDVAEPPRPRNLAAASDLLLRCVDRAFARTCQLRARINRHDTTTIHRTRVAFKKFRYMVETLAHYLGAADPKLLEAMHHYQTMMGEIQDAEVLLQTLDKYLLKNQRDAKPARPFREELARRRLALISAYLDSAGQLLDFWPSPKRSAVAPHPRRSQLMRQT